MIDKLISRRPESNFYKTNLRLKDTPTFHTISADEKYDPGKIMFKYGYPFEWWSLILRLNNLIDPINDLVVGLTIAIPTKKDLKRIQLEQER